MREFILKIGIFISGFGILTYIGLVLSILLKDNLDINISEEKLWFLITFILWVIFSLIFFYKIRK